MKREKMVDKRPRRHDQELMPIGPEESSLKASEAKGEGF